jgi:tRNA modification GTPase
MAGMSATTDTIAAIATAPGRGGIGVVRVSGPAVPDIAEGALGFTPEPRVATHAAFRDADGTTIDDGLAILFPSPRSFTGEHVLELQGHGGQVVLNLLLKRVLELGARAARPGEFSERAFLNGKLDLVQAEAVADLIDSGSAHAARAAMRSLAGEFSENVNAVVDGVADLRAYIEAAMDFPDEEIDFLAEGDISGRCKSLIEQLDALTRIARQGSLMHDGLQVVIAGAPNVGKSTLLNRLAGHDAAIVTAIPGTTRDPLRERIDLDGLPVQLVDTAGLRDGDDPIEQEGIRRSRREIERADRILLIVEASGPSAVPEEFLGLPVTVIHNKVDLTGEPAGRVDGTEPPVVRISAEYGQGLDALRNHLKAIAGWAPAEGSFSARRRHMDALDRARQHLVLGLDALQEQRAGELMAEELRLAQGALGEITGTVTTEDLLGRIFSSFCIGK